MVKLKKLFLKNYCGYRDTVFDFEVHDKKGDFSIYYEIPCDGSVKNLIALFSPNGAGKSNCLKAINYLGSSYQYKGRENDLFFRKMVYHPDYDPTFEGFIKSTEHMEIKGIFNVNGEEKQVIINENGVVLDELPIKDYPKEHTYYIDADNPINLAKFQINSKDIDNFLKMAECVYGFKCSVDGLIEDYGEKYYTDFIIQKEDGTKVHYRRMSGGERKLTQLCDALCNSIWIDNIDIIIIDSFDKEIYFSRHAKMINTMLDTFPNKQFIIATHSPVLVGMNDEELKIDIPAYLPYECLYNVEELRV
jgi:AAA15 family ATPase/GTPase